MRSALAVLLVITSAFALRDVIIRLQARLLIVETEYALADISESR